MSEGFPGSLLASCGRQDPFGVPRAVACLRLALTFLSEAGFAECLRCWHCPQLEHLLPGAFLSVQRLIRKSLTSVGRSFRHGLSFRDTGQRDTGAGCAGRSQDQGPADDRSAVPDLDPRILLGQQQQWLEFKLTQEVRKEIELYRPLAHAMLAGLPDECSLVSQLIWCFC